MPKFPAYAILSTPVTFVYLTQHVFAIFCLGRSNPASINGVNNGPAAAAVPYSASNLLSIASSLASSNTNPVNSCCSNNSCSGNYIATTSSCSSAGAAVASFSAENGAGPSTSYHYYQAAPLHQQPHQLVDYHPHHPHQPAVAIGQQPVISQVELLEDSSSLTRKRLDSTLSSKMTRVSFGND